VNIALEVNGQQVEWDISPGATLYEALRAHGLCVAEEDDEGAGCAVVLDGQPVDARTVAAIRAHGGTLETLAENAPDAHPDAHQDDGQDDLVTVIRGNSMDEAIKRAKDAMAWGEEKLPTESYLKCGSGMVLALDTLQDGSSQPFAAQFAHVEVDAETGEVFLRKVVSALDTSADVDHLQAEEQGSRTLALAIGEAVFDAAGVRLEDTPATSEDVWRAMMELEEEKDG
jgi:CO/xanthine dehydrogenase Mo-binding subunit